MSVGRTLAGIALAPVPLLVPLMLLDGELFVAFLPVVYGTAMLIGIPTHRVLKSRKRRDLRAYLAVSALAALTAVIALTAASHILADAENPFRFRRWCSVVSRSFSRQS